MTIQRLDHVNIRTAQLAAVVDFYEKVIGLSVGPRPGLAITGAGLRQLHLHDPDGNHLELNFLIDDN